MIAIGALAADELADVALSILLSNLPAIIFWLHDNYDNIKNEVDKLLARWSNV